MAIDTRRVPKETSSRTGRAPRRRPAASPVTLTGRGGIVVVAAFTLVGAGLGTLFDAEAAQGFCFFLGCVLAAVATRRADLITLTVSPPLTFFCVSLLTAALGSVGDTSFVMSVLLTVATTLTSNVPWLFLGSLLVVVIALPRGLPSGLRELRARVAADNPFRDRKELSSRGSGAHGLRKGGLREIRRKGDDDPVRWDESPGRRVRGDAD